MKVGDLVKRKKGEYQGCGGYGFIVALYHAGKPSHKCANVLWTNDGNTYGIACSIIEVVNENR